MKPTKAELIERHEQLLKLDDVLTEHEKTAHFSMWAYEQITPCGTVCCLAGFASKQPWFRDEGFDCYSIGEDEFFGRQAFNELFSSDLSSIWPEAMQRVRDRLERIKAMPEEQA